MSEYYYLKHGDIILPGDEVDASNDGWRDDPVWKPTTCAGQQAPDPQYPAHRRYRRKLMDTFPNPLMIQLGQGRIIVEPFSDDEGHGIILKDTGEPHEIGSLAPDLPETEDGTQPPEHGEVYIHCANRESAIVLLEQVARYVALFSPNTAETLTITPDGEVHPVT